MPVRCEDCNTSFLLSNADVVHGVECHNCGSNRLERDQPSGTNSDGDLRDMVDPSIGLDQGGNPLQEGIWATTDKGFQPLDRRDESFASVRTTHTLEPLNMELYMPWQHEADVKESALPALGLLGGLAGGVLRMAAPSLLRGAIMGRGNSAPVAPMPVAPIVDIDPMQALQPVAKTADIETPHTTPFLHDDPDGDTQQYRDGDMSPDFQNPNISGEAGGSQSPHGEDATQQSLQFNDDILKDIEPLLEKLVDAYHSEDSGLNDPLIRALHEKVDQQYPGYLDQAGDDDSSVQALFKAMRDPNTITAAAPAPMNQGQIPGMQLPGQQLQMTNCANCGGTLNADGTCSQCGFNNVGQQPGGVQQPMQQGHPLAPGNIQHNNFASVTAADHQGPATPEQKEMFAEYLIAQGRVDEVGQMYQAPEMYADEWAEVQNRPTTHPPTVDPNEPPPMPPPMDPSMMGQGMPMPGMAPPGAGMTPMSSTRQASDSFTPRCPSCNSATTGTISEDGAMRCHSCDNIWERDAIKTMRSARTWTRKLAQEPFGVPAADQDAPDTPNTDSSLSWQDTDGNQLEVGGVYEMHSEQSPIPDLVKIQAVRPDGITMEVVGEEGQDTTGMVHTIDNAEKDEAGLTFVPQTETEPDEDAEGPGQTVNTEPVPTPAVPGIHASVEPERCPSCNYGHITSSMKSPTLKEWECYRCTNQWTTHEAAEDVEVNLDSRAWLNESEISFEGFDERALAMASAGRSRSIGDIVERDPRSQKIKEVLAENARTAGRKMTPREQKEFIDEEGDARNKDRLNLTGTHYEFTGTTAETINDSFF